MDASNDKGDGCASSARFGGAARIAWLQPVVKKAQRRTENIKGCPGDGLYLTRCWQLQAQEHKAHMNSSWPVP